ncbi:hypothetical protein MASR2M70_02690 [Bacillota bacterium]
MGRLGRNKKGYSTVFMCMILSATLLLTGFFGEMAAGLASRSYANAIFDLAGRSILSEYDRTLKSRYGIFAFLLDDEVIENKLIEYAGASLGRGMGKSSLLPLEIRKISVDSGEFVLTNLDLLEEQIVDHMKYRILIDSLNILDLLDSKERDNEESFSFDEKEDEQTEQKIKGRTLRKLDIINGLPSRVLEGMDGGFINILNLPKPAEMGEIAYNELCLNRYILRYFRHNSDEEAFGDTFFRNEIEYILCGRLSDDANSNIVYLSLLSFRTIINTAHIYADSNKLKAVTAAAALAGGGVATAAAQAAITLAWAGAEAASDMGRLRRGEGVPLIKTADDWVLGLEKVLEGVADSVIPPEDNQKGLRYEDYLFLLLCFKSRESKLIRIMDLIQLNIKGSDNDTFAMAKCLYGFRFEAELSRTRGFPGIFPRRTGVITGTHVY